MDSWNEVMHMCTLSDMQICMYVLVTYMQKSNEPPFLWWVIKSCLVCLCRDLYTYVCVCVSHINFFCIWFRYFRCRAMCRKSVQSAARRAFSNWSAAMIPIPLGHWLVEHLTLALSLSLALSMRLCSRSYWPHRFLLELTKIAVPIVYIGAHTLHMPASCNSHECVVCVRACACVCMVTTGSRAVNVCTSSIINKALLPSQLSLSLSLSLPNAFVNQFWAFLAALCAFRSAFAVSFYRCGRR